MRRRTNKSSKVPNVKLRPAPARELSRTSSERYLVADSQVGSDDTTVVDFCPRPFKNLVLCATGIKDKPALFKKALELGATHVSAFTDRVTHLIADTHEGAKYMCALERKIPIMKPSWVEESYDIWLRGDDVDYEESLETHRLPIFSGVVLCLSGITDVDRRVEINRLVTQNGGTYVKNLERPVRVTHLLCSGDEETEKMRYAEKFNKRKEAVIHLLWEEWFWDSLEFGGRFDETRYEVSRPRPERKALQDVVASSPPPSDLPSEMNETSVAPPVPAKTQQLSPSTSQDDEDEVATVKVLPAVTLQIWGSLLNRRGYQVSGNTLVRTTSAPVIFQNPEDSHEVEPGKSVISAFRRANSFAPAKLDEPESVGTSRQPFRRTATSANVFSRSGTPLPVVPEKNGESSSTSVDLNPVAGPSKAAAFMFAGYRFRALGEAKTPAVKNAVESYGGRMVSEHDDGVDYIIVRLVSGSKLYREETDPVLHSKYRTECWLERCIFEDRICPPDQDISFLPLAIQIPVPGAHKILLSLSGFDQSESCGLRRLLRALGITLAPNFSKNTTHLLCPSATGPKFVKACEWGKPVVQMSWLAAIASTGAIPSVEGHLVPGNTLKSREISKIDFGVPMDVDVKGKGKAKAIPQDLPLLDVGTTMNDITNTDSSESPGELPQFVNVPSHLRQPVKPQTSSASISFGQPKYGLVAPSIPPTRAQSLASIPPQSSSLSPASACTIPSHVLQQQQQESITQSDNSSVNNDNNNINGPRPSRQELEHERLTAKIPSSRTPSPMKLRKSGSRSSVSVSPVKIDHEATKALQESITRALKRHTSEEDEVLNGGRNSKRQRPQRQKAPSRQTSLQKLRAEVDPIPVIPFAETTISPFDSLDIAEGDMLSVIESKKDTPTTRGAGRRTRCSASNAIGLSEEASESSMRVTYEDPGLADERKKLMDLLKTQSQGTGEKGSPSKAAKVPVEPTRRGMRTRKRTRTT
ncbi:S-M checkpoint control protein rad4 [Leucoagaricus sp. SymC.cos]|nr:S-M checkpoint control protein rad4 [Leucoagaricus sp. SymC.cos]